MSNEAIDTAARFGDIPFVEFTKGLVTGVFDSLVASHVSQMEEYAQFVNSLTQDLSAYINNTNDGVSFSDISQFIQNFELPQIAPEAQQQLMQAIQTAATTPVPLPTTVSTISTGGTQTQPATDATWWGGLINALSPAIQSLVNKIPDKNAIAGIQQVHDYNLAVLEAQKSNVAVLAEKIPNYKNIHDAIASLICSNKYALLQTMAKQGVMRLVVTEGEIETKITFSTWNTSESGSENTHTDSVKTRSVQVNNFGSAKVGLFRRSLGFQRNRDVARTVTVNTAKSYQRDTSGTRVDIFGRVLIKFKTDYAPLNG